MAEQVKTIKSSGGDYASLQLWEDDADGESTTTDPWVAECYSGFNLGAVTFSAFTDPPTQQSEAVRIYAASGHEHDGISGGAYIDTTANSQVSFNFPAGVTGYFIVDGIRTDGKNSTYTTTKCLYVEDASIEVLNCVFYNFDSQSVHLANITNEATGVWILRNTIVNDSDSHTVNALVDITSSSFTLTIQNCVLYNGGSATQALRAQKSGTNTHICVLENTIMHSTGATTLSFGVMTSTTVNNCATEDSTADNYGGTGNIVDQTMTDIFNNPASGNFFLKAGSNAIAAGKDLSGTFTTDIVGATFGATWDMGAYFYHTTPVISTIKSSGGTYSSLQLWEDAVDGGYFPVQWAECYSGFSLGPFAKSAWVAESSAEAERRKVYAAPGHEHDGSWSTGVGAYSSITSGWNIKAYGQQLDYFTFEGILFVNSKNNEGTVLISGGGGGMKLEFKRCWFHKTHVTVTGQNVYIQTNSSSDASDVLIENCIVRRGTAGLYLSTGSGSPAFIGTIRNCTVYGCSVRGVQAGFTGSTTVTFTLQNTICGENPTADIYINAVDTLVVQNNISTDATADDDGGTNHQINVDAADIWVDAANGDFRLVHGSKAKDKGVAIAGVVTDITGVRRPQGGYHDCGAYEAKRVGGGRMRSYNRRKGRLRVSDVRARRG